MTPTLVKNFIVVCICAFIALILGFAVSTQSYDLIVLPVILALFVATIVIPGYAFLIGFGLICPFILPLPFVWGMPMLVFILGLCALKYIIRRSLGRESWTLPRSVPAMLFFGWVFFRYCMNPVKPGIAVGASEAVTGFRSYLSYASCAAVFVAMGLFRTFSDVRKLLRWMLILATGMIMLLLPLVFTKSVAVVSVLETLGLYVAAFDNGWLRFVVLPDFGLILFTAAFLPNLFRMSKFWRACAFILGVIAIVIGGNRSSVVMFFITIVILAYYKRRAVGLAIATVAVALTLFTLYYIGESDSTGNAALYRLTSLVSPRASGMTEDTMTWRKLRWERALQDIYAHPIVGMSYGGLENAFVFADRSDFETAAVEIDVATGGIHNGYLATARAMGVPCALLFIYILIFNTLRAAKRAMTYKTVDMAQSDLQAFIWLNLAAMAVSIYIGTDVNSSRLWFLLGLASWVPYSAAARRQAEPISPEVPVHALPA